MIRHIFSDMDGTLLNSEGQIGSNNLRRIIQSPIPFTLVSARAPMEMDEAIHELKLVEPQIAFNGGVIFERTNHGFNILQDDPLALENIKKIVAIIKTDFPNVSYSCYDLNNWYAEKIDTGTEYESSITGITPTLIDFDELLNQDKIFYKLMLITFDKTEMKSLNQKLKMSGIVDVSLKQSGSTYLEITSKHAQKSKGIEFIQAREKLSFHEMAAFGDGHNDLPMLTAVGTPIVMDNALPEIKNYGKFITKSNDHDGVAYGIENYLEVKA